jgi:hypothetical protein
MTRGRLTWVIVTGVMAVLVAGTVDAVRSSEPWASSSSRETTTQQSAARETALPVETTPKSLPRCTAQHIGVSIDVLGERPPSSCATSGAARVISLPLPVRLSVTDRVGRRVRLSPQSESVVKGDFAPGFERLIDITYLSKCDQRGPYTTFVIAGPYSAQRKLFGREVGCFRGG